MPGTTFLHTADWQLGKPFASISDEAKRHRVQHERLECLGRIAALAAEHQAAFVLVAGDLFDSAKATRATVSAACQAIGRMKVPVVVIPGNHDHAGAGSIWEQEFYVREQRALATNLHVLLTPEPLLLESAVILPAPLRRRHETADPTLWVRTAPLQDLPANRPRIVLAHGSIQGFGTASVDEDEMSSSVNLLDLSRLPWSDVDYAALGDWHGVQQVGAKAWYSGTPEMDRFPKGTNHEQGYVLKVTVSRGQSPEVEKLRTHHLVWSEMAFAFSGDPSLEVMLANLEERVTHQAERHLLHLVLTGSLGIAAAGQLERHIESWESRLLRLKLENYMTLAPTEEELSQLTTGPDPLIASVANQLVARLSGEPDAAAVARLALRELHSARLKCTREEGGAGR